MTASIASSSTRTTGERVSASPQYTIDVLTDQPPTVSIAKPGRDTNASPIEEVFVEARAEDDFGVRDLELVYSVNGGAEKTIRLFDGKNRLAEVTAGHTFYLEELKVTPGDFVSYYARAADNDAVRVAKRTTSDIYFLQIRPLRKEFRRAESEPAAGAVAAVAPDRSARCRSSSVRSSRRRSTSTAIARRCRPTSCARTRRDRACRSRSCAIRSTGCSRE